jgi:leucyl aminopeptidase (aminopeptidase T)
VRPKLPRGAFGGKDRALVRAARVAVSTCLGVQPAERVLIVTNPVPDSSRIARALYDAVLEAEGQPTLLYQPVRSQLEFADEAVYAALASRPPVFISISRLKLGQDARGVAAPYAAGGKSYDSLFHALLYGEKAVRAFWSPEVNRRIFTAAVPIDYARLAADCARVKPLLDRAVRARITAPGGTELELGLEGRLAAPDNGDFRRPGCGGNLPAGEVFISPQLGTARGWIGFDGSLALPDRVVTVRRPVQVEVRDGLVGEIRGGPEAGLLEGALREAAEQALALEREGKLASGLGQSYAGNTRNLGELGIGLNRATRILGNMLNDEKVYGTCHLAIGRSYDQDAPTLLHLDCLVRRPTIQLTFAGGDSVTLLRDGRLEEG